MKIKYEFNRAKAFDETYIIQNGNSQILRGIMFEYYGEKEEDPEYNNFINYSGKASKIYAFINNVRYLVISATYKSMLTIPYPFTIATLKKTLKEYYEDKI